MDKLLIASDIQPVDALYFSFHGAASLHINLASIDDGIEQVTPSIRLDGIDLPTDNLPDDLLSLQGQTFTFPVESDGHCDDDCIDGSIYWQARHHPVEVTQLSFGHAAGSVMPVHVTGCVIMIGEEQPRQFPIEFTAPIHLQLTEAQIENLLITAMQASGERHLGRLMAAVKPAVRYTEQLGQVSAIARRLLDAPA